MRWWPSRDEIILAGNLLRHADVCISPGSTMTVEAAIFDTPTIVPTFNPAMPEEYDRQFRADWLNKHLSFLVQEDTVAVARSQEELITAIRRTLNDRTWLKDGRRKIREDLLGPLDGRATERLAQAAVRCASNRHAISRDRTV
jgi:predicted glycosyltransferase